MRYQRAFTVSYVFLLAMSLFAPEAYGVMLRYVFAPLMLMLLFGVSNKGISLRLKFKPYFLLCLGWVVVMIYSTLHSQVVTWGPSARSFCMLVLFFALLYELIPNEQCLEIVKHTYICMTLFCAFWIILQSFFGIDRNNFILLFWRKDVNYLAAFMLPGVYMAMHFLMIETGKHKATYILCVLGSFVGILLVQSRAAFLTLLIVAVLCFFQYMSKKQLSRTQIVIYLLAAVAANVVVAFIWNTEAFSRLTNVEGYKEDDRLEIWKYAMQAYEENPVWGSGLGASIHYAQEAKKYDTHNNYIDILGDSGIVGVSLFILLCLQILKAPKGERLHMLSYFVACMLPMAFVNGLQTISFWLPMLLLAHENVIITRRIDDGRNNYLTS